MQDKRGKSTNETIAPNYGKTKIEYKEQKAAGEENAAKFAKEGKEQKAAAGEAALKSDAHIKKLAKSDAEKKALKSAAENKATKEANKATPK